MTKNIKKVDADFYKNEGMAIFIKGQMVIGIAPDNLENNLNALKTGDMRIDWETLATWIKNIDPTESAQA